MKVVNDNAERAIKRIEDYNILFQQKINNINSMFYKYKPSVEITNPTQKKVLIWKTVYLIKYLLFAFLL